MASASPVVTKWKVRCDWRCEGLQHMVQDSRTIAETSLRAIDEAGKTFSGVAQPGATQG